GKTRCFITNRRQHTRAKREWSSDVCSTNIKHTIIDVRSEESYKKAHIQGAINLPIDSLRDSLNSLNKKNKIVVYCGLGESSLVAQEILVNNGFEKVYNLTGGLSNYRTLNEEKISKESK